VYGIIDYFTFIGNLPVLPMALTGSQSKSLSSSSLSLPSVNINFHASLANIHSKCLYTYTCMPAWAKKMLLHHGPDLSWLQEETLTQNRCRADITGQRRRFLTQDSSCMKYICSWQLLC